ncbi:MAG: hypothetical protein JXA38_04345 [Methanosarcinaceae archaeon]|nr:hypothetical protein [Methanosarcinaceae archaeon]
MKLGKHAQHTHNKYKNMRKKLQKQGKYKKVKQIKNRESRIVRDLNHEISRKIVDNDNENNCGIKLEELKCIRNNKKTFQIIPILFEQLVFLSATKEDRI